MKGCRRTGSHGCTKTFSVLNVSHLCSLAGGQIRMKDKEISRKLFFFVHRNVTSLNCSKLLRDALSSLFFGLMKNESGRSTKGILGRSVEAACV